MASRRDAIRMTDDEVRQFLESQKVGVLGTSGVGGFPHLVTVGYLFEEGHLTFTSFAAAQKVRNLERDPKATFLVEVSWPYNEIRGVMMSGPAMVTADTDLVIDVSRRMQRRHAEMSGDQGGTPEIKIERHAPKRVVVTIRPEITRSWDHTKLAGTY